MTNYEGNHQPKKEKSETQVKIGFTVYNRTSWEIVEGGIWATDNTYHLSNNMYVQKSPLILFGKYLIF